MEAYPVTSSGPILAYLTQMERLGALEVAREAKACLATILRSEASVAMTSSPILAMDSPEDQEIMVDLVADSEAGVASVDLCLAETDNLLKICNISSLLSFYTPKYN